MPRPGYEECKASFPKDQAPREQEGPGQTSYANDSATGVLPREYKANFGV